MTELTRDNNELDVIFANASVPDISDLTGKYYVDMLTGLPSLRWLGHHKIFYTDDGKPMGYNVAIVRWGHFAVETGILESDGVGYVLFNYNIRRNTFISRKIRDYVRCIEAGQLYLGRTNSMRKGELRFVGYFSLSRS